jgi:hypothetical protein
MPSAFLTVADTLELSSAAGTARATAARTFGRCPDEVPAARRFLREALDGHPAAFDVIDDGQTGLPHWREATVEDEGGRGFQLVNEIAQRWGFLRERARTCVWFELAPDR